MHRCGVWHYPFSRMGDHVYHVEVCAVKGHPSRRVSSAAGGRRGHQPVTLWMGGRNENPGSAAGVFLCCFSVKPRAL